MLPLHSTKTNHRKAQEKLVYDAIQYVYKVWGKSRRRKKSRSIKKGVCQVVSVNFFLVILVKGSYLLEAVDFLLLWPKKDAEK